MLSDKPISAMVLSPTIDIRCYTRGGGQLYGFEMIWLKVWHLNSLMSIKNLPWWLLNRHFYILRLRPENTYILCISKWFFSWCFRYELHMLSLFSFYIHSSLPMHGLCAGDSLFSPYRLSWLEQQDARQWPRYSLEPGVYMDTDSFFILSLHLR